MSLSILIPIAEKDEIYFSEVLYPKLLNMSIGYEVELIPLHDYCKNIGRLRNNLLMMSQKKYISFIDADDNVSSDYIEEIFKAIEGGFDCCSLRGVITWDGENPEIFEHSIKYSAYATTQNPIKYERYPNHLNCIKSSIAKQFSFPEINHGEDTDWATQIYKSGLIKSEYYTDKILYHYLYKTNK